MTKRSDPTISDRKNRAGLYLWERIGLVVVGVLLIGFAGLVELRGAFQTTRKTDLNCYTRAAYAVLTGGDIYQATDDNGNHYTYPPAFAVLMVPFADAPKGLARDGLIPHALTVAIWTLFNYLLMGRIVHVLATLVLPDEVRGSRRWWYARTVPVYATIAGVGESISMGQVNILMIALIVEMFRAGQNGQRVRSGLWLAAAIVLKVIPAFLLLDLAMRRDLRAGLGVLLGLVIGLGVIPVAGLGVDGSVRATTTFVERILLPGAAGPTDPKHDLKELMHLHGGNSHSFLFAIHCNIHTDRRAVPTNATPATRNAHMAISAVLTLTMFCVGWRNGLKTTRERLLALGLCLQLMVHVNPMSHLYYYMFMLPVVAAFWLSAMAQAPGQVCPPWRLMWPVVLWGVAMSLPLLPGELAATVRHHGFMLAVSMLVWAHGLRTLAFPRHARAVSLSETAPLRPLPMAA